MEASHKTHRPHIKVGKDEEEDEDLSTKMKQGNSKETVPMMTHTAWSGRTLISTISILNASSLTLIDIYKLYKQISQFLVFTRLLPIQMATTKKRIQDINLTFGGHFMYVILL